MVDAGPARTSPVAAAFAVHWPTLVARLARRFGDLGLAEECAAEAFATAVQAWRGEIPENPGAWLWVTAERRAVDRVRRQRRFGERIPVLASASSGAGAERDDPEPDHLALLFGCCHPSLSRDSKVALTLRSVNGLSTEQIAAVFLTSTDTMTRRLTRARRKLAANAVPFSIPEPAEWSGRLAPVLEVIYLTFTAGHAAASGATFVRGDLCDESRWLISLVTRVAPGDPEVLGLAALLEFTDARRAARLDGDGRLVLMADQNRSLWDPAAIRRGRDLLARALSQRRVGRFQAQAALSGCHTMAPSWQETDWQQMLHWYDVLIAVDDTPITRLNRAVALTQSGSLDEALRHIDELSDELSTYHYLWIARADVNERLGLITDAVDDLERAIALDPHAVEVAELTSRLECLRPPSGSNG